MKLKAWLSVLGALLLGACGHHHHHQRYGQFVPPDPAQPAVTLRSDNKLVVNQEPLYVPKDGVVTFRLPPGSGLTFAPDNGLRVLGRIKNEEGVIIPLDTRSNEAFTNICRPGTTAAAGGKDGTADPQALVCKFPSTGNKVLRGMYAYELNVVGPQGRIRVDPSVYPPDP